MSTDSQWHFTIPKCVLVRELTGVHNSDIIDSKCYNTS